MSEEKAIALGFFIVVALVAILVMIARASKKADYPSGGRLVGVTTPNLLARSNKPRSGGIWFILAIVAALWFVSYSNDQAKKENEAKEQYLKLHPLSAKQMAANEHFYNCYNYARASSAEMSENQRKTLLGLEGCYPDRRDDPRYDDATDPWNANAPQPWKAR